MSLEHLFAVIQPLFGLVTVGALLSNNIVFTTVIFAVYLTVGHLAGMSVAVIVLSLSAFD